MLNKIKKHIEDNALLDGNDHVLVGLSGGADSVCLLTVLCELGYRTSAAHCNFQLRGEESTRDELFVRDLCEKMGVRLHVTHFDTCGYAREHGQSIEMAARELRYGYFSRLMKEEGYSKTAIAHHSDDSIETMLINLLRGTGLRGLCGIRAKNGKTVRPLLCCSREEVLGFLRERSQAYVTDSTNLSTDYVRNKVRLQLLPLMQEISPSARETLLTTISNLQEEEKVYGWCMRRMEEESSYVDDYGVLHISKEGLQRSPSPMSLLHEALRDCGFNRSQLMQILGCMDKTGRRFFSAEFQLTVDRDYLVVTGITDERGAETPSEMEITGDEGILELADGERIAYRVVGRDELEIQKDRSHAYFDLRKLGRSLTVRLAEKGDWLIPFGMKGRKLVSDLLTDMKVPALEKARQLVVCSGGRIAWVLGRRASEEFRVDDDTELVVEMETKLFTI